MKATSERSRPLGPSRAQSCPHQPRPLRPPLHCLLGKNDESPVLPPLRCCAADFPDTSAAPAPHRYSAGILGDIHGRPRSSSASGAGLPGDNRRVPLLRSRAWCPPLSCCRGSARQLRQIRLHSPAVPLPRENQLSFELLNK